MQMISQYCIYLLTCMEFVDFHSMNIEMKFQLWEGKLHFPQKQIAFKNVEIPPQHT